MATMTATTTLLLGLLLFAIALQGVTSLGRPLVTKVTTTALGGPTCLLMGSATWTSSMTTSLADHHRRRRQHRQRQCCTVLWMGKGDGKKKRPKKKKNSSTAPPAAAAASSSSSSSSATPTPQRVSADLNIPIRRQIAYAKLNKAFREGASGNGRMSFRQTKKVRTKYRRTWNETEWDQAAEQRRKRGQDVDWAVVLNSTLYKTPPLVMVDGYNIIYAWPRLKKHMVRGDLERARRLLCDDLEELAMLKQWRIEVVFDAAQSTNNNQQTLGTNPRAMRSTSTAAMAPNIQETSASSSSRKQQNLLGRGRVRTVFTGRGIEADSYIETRCMDAKHQTTNGKFTPGLMVATDDAMIRTTAVSAGALCMSASRFVTELKACQQATRYRVEAAMAHVNGQPMRPQALWGTDVWVNGGGSSIQATSSSSSSVIDHEVFGRVEKVETRADGSAVYVPRYGSSRSGVIIEDRRNRNKKKKRQLQQQQQQQQQNHNGMRNGMGTKDSSNTTHEVCEAQDIHGDDNVNDDDDTSSRSTSTSSMFDVLGKYKNEKS